MKKPNYGHYFGCREDQKSVGGRPGSKGLVGGLKL